LETNKKTIITSCPHDCGGRCVLKVHIEDGIIRRIETDDGEEPQYRACPRGRAYRKRVYSEERLKYPMKRTGKRGEGKFERISWDEAFRAVADEMGRVKETYGNQSILYIAYSGNTGTFLHGQLSVFRLLTMFGGFTAVRGSASFWGSLFNSEITYGTVNAGHTSDDILNSKYIILWGFNPAVSINRTNTSWYLTRAKEQGAKIVSIDPRYTDSAAAFAGQWVPIRPGTDTAMLVAMAHVMIEENLLDRDFLNTYTTGFDAFEGYVLGSEDGEVKDPRWAESITGVKAHTIRSIARDYATMKPGKILTLGAPGRTAFGEQFHRAASTLAAMTGNIGIEGGDPAGFNLPSVGLQPAAGTGLISGKVIANLPEGARQMSTIHITRLWDALLTGKSGGHPADIKLVYITNSNAVNPFMNANRAAEALQKPETVIVHEQFMTPTAKFADYLLPVNTHLERNDIIRPWQGGPYFIYMNKAIESLHESKSDFEISVGMAKALGIKEFSDKTEDEWLREMWENAKGLTDSKPLPEYEEFREKGIHKIPLEKPVIAFEKQRVDPDNNPFPTESGKIEIFSKKLAAQNVPDLPPIPKYIRAWEGRDDELAGKYPLQLVSTHNKVRVHSQMYNNPWLRDLEEHVVWINTADASERGIHDGDNVMAFNDRGKVLIRAKVTERIMPGVVSISEGAWYNPDEEGVDRGGCVNVLLKDAHSPAGSFCSNTCLVQIEKAKE